MSMSTVRFIQVLGLPNLALLLFLTPVMNGALLAAEDPRLFHQSGVLLIGLWGLAYIFVAPSWRKLWPMMFVFAVEKAVYVWAWIQWMESNQQRVGSLIEQDLFVGLFFAAYGIWDGFCMVMFLIFGFRAMKL
jgi:hypothetical protein